MPKCSNAYCKVLYNFSSQVSKGSLKPAAIQERPHFANYCVLWQASLPTWSGKLEEGQGWSWIDIMQRRAAGR